MGDIFYEKLFDTGQIPSKVFSLHYADQSGLSFITLGEYDEDQQYYEEELVWLTMDAEEFYWQTTITGVEIAASKFALAEGGTVIFDSGSPLIYLPKEGGTTIIKKMLSWTGFHFKFFGTYFVNCKVKKHKALSFLINGYWIDLAPQSFITDYEVLGGLLCTLGFQLIDMNDLYIFGDVFFRNYYTVFDAEGGTLGLAPRKDGYNGLKIKEGTVPNKSLD